MEDTAVELQIHDAKEKTIWTKSVSGRRGFNQTSSDLIVKNNNSPEPYFWRYSNYAQPGEYELRIVGQGIDLKTDLTVVR